jgi:polyisoprenoid-binding protein YceI
MIAFIATFLLTQNFLSAQPAWDIDPVHSNVTFTVTHLVISEVEGSFRVFSGKMLASKEDFTDANIDFTVDVKSINTNNETRDKHLKSDDFFNAEKFPQMTFSSKSFRKVSGNKYLLSGNLTIRDITKIVVFNVTYGGTEKDRQGNAKAGFTATTTINRFDYNLKWNALTEAGGAVVSPDVKILLNLEFIREKGK